MTETLSERINGDVPQPRVKKRLDPDERTMVAFKVKQRVYDQIMRNLARENEERSRRDPPAKQLTLTDFLIMSTTGKLEAENEIYARLERIDARLDRLEDLNGLGGLD